MNPTDVNYGTSEFWTWDDAMWSQLRWLRENDPVHWSEKSGLWILSRFEHVFYVSKNNDLFCSGQGVLPSNPAKLGLIDDDEPRHQELRRLVNKGFTPRMVRKLEEDFEGIVQETLDDVAGRGRCDFVDDIAVPLPLLIIADMIGVRREDRQRFHHWSDSMILAQGNLDAPGVADRAAQAFMEYAQYCTAILEDRRANPRDDLMSVLVNAKDDGVLRVHDAAGDARIVRSEEQRRLGNDELTMFCVLLLVAGNETTRNGLSGGMKLLIEHPEARQRLVDDPSLIPAACEEMLRLTSPVISFVRTATEDTELGGKRIAKGQKVLMLYPSANRDADVFDDPDVFDIDRNPQHLAFGIGNHFCLGANLARMEMRVAFRELMRRIPDMRYANGGPVMAPSGLVRSFQHMNVLYTPETARASAAAQSGAVHANS